MGTVRIEDKTPWQCNTWLLEDSDKLEVHLMFGVFISSFNDYEVGEACFIADKAIINMIDSGV